MSDNVLEDFFAKKDKKKRSKSKFTTSNSIAKNLEDGGKKSDFVKKDCKEKLPLSSSNNTSENDDEWKNIDDEKERDYSGLRIQALSMSEKEKEEEQLKEQQMAEQNGEMMKMLDGQSGPWKIVSAPTPPPVEIVEEEMRTPTEEVKEDTSVKTMAYKIPALRNVSASTTPSSNISRKYPKSAPQISSELHFPSLASALNDSTGRYSEMDQSFQSVKHGIRSKNETQHGLQLDLENKFSALHQGDHV